MENKIDGSGLMNDKIREMITEPRNKPLIVNKDMFMELLEKYNELEQFKRNVEKMTERYVVRQQGENLWAVNDTIAEFNIVNGIPSKIEAKILADEMNELYSQNILLVQNTIHLEQKYKQLNDKFEVAEDFVRDKGLEIVYSDEEDRWKLE